MRTVETHLLGDKMDEAVTHYMNAHQPNEPVHIDTNGIPMTVQDDGAGRVTIMHQQTYTTQMCRQVSVTEQVGEGPWGEELLEGPIAAIVAHLQNSRHHPPPHHKVAQVRTDVDSSVILDGPMRFNGQTLLPPMQTLPPLQEMKRCADTDWFNDKNKKDEPSMLQDSDSQVLEMGASASPAQHKQSRKSLPHKKRISRKLKRNNGNSTPHQELVVINCSEPVPAVAAEQEQILPDSYVAVPQHHHMSHEVRPMFICQICGDYYGEEQLKFYHHLKQHYEPHATIIIENPVPDLAMDKMANNCIVDNVATLPDSIVELSLENTVPKTMYQPIDKHILYTSSDKTLTYNSNKVQYSMASMDKEPPAPVETEKGDLYETLDKLDLYNCGKCTKTFRKQKQCEAHMREAHSNNTKLEDMGEFSEPEDLMAGIQVCVDAEPYEHTLLPHLTVDNGQVHQDHTRHWYSRGGCTGAYCGVCARDPDPPLKVLKEEVLQRIFDSEVSDNANFADHMMPDHDVGDPEPDHDRVHSHDHEHNDHRHNDHKHNDHGHERLEHDHLHDEHSHGHNEHSHGHNEHSHGHNEHSLGHNEHSLGHNEHSHGHNGHTHAHNEHLHRHNEHSHGHTEHSHGHNDHSHRQSEHSREHNEHSSGPSEHSFRRNDHGHEHNQHSDFRHHEHDQEHSEHSLGHNEHSLGHNEHSHGHNEHGNEHSGNDHGRNEHGQVDPAYEVPVAQDDKRKDEPQHVKKRHFQCPECPRVFSHRNSLLYHVLSHGGRKHACRDCGKGFYTLSALKIHRRTHNNDRPYKCDVCGREFRQWSDLKSHNISLHTDKKLYKCQFCGKEFARKYSLSLHVRIHTGEKNYKCEFCSKTFRCSSYRLTHMRTHTGDRPYKCEQCDKSFRSTFDLRRHALVHDKVRNRFDENKAKPKETQKKTKMVDTKEVKVETPEPPKKIKQIAVASTASPPAAIVKKLQKNKKTPPKKGAPNVTVQNRGGQFKVNDDYANNVEVYDSREYAKFKNVYSDSDGGFKNHIVYEDEQPQQRDLAVLRPIYRGSGVDNSVSEKLAYRPENTDGKMLVFTHNADGEKVLRSENTDGKMHVFTHVEKAKDYTGSIVSNTQVLGDIRHLEREVAREVRSEIAGEGIETGFLERLTAMYNISAV